MHNRQSPIANRQSGNRVIGYSGTRAFSVGARVAYIAIVLLATLANLQFTWDPAAAAERLRRAVSLSLEWRDAIDGIRNIALFAGMGVVWIVTATSRRPSVRAATVAGCLLSATVEGLQCFSPVRTASWIDVCTNTLGTLAGAVAILALIEAVGRRRGAKSYLGVPTNILVAAYLGALACEALTPLFESKERSGLGIGPLGLLRMSIQMSLPLALTAIRLSDVPLYFAGGFVVVMLVGEHGAITKPAVAAIGVMGLVGATVLHVSHGLYGLPIRWEVVATDAVSVLAGAAFARAALPALTRSIRGPHRARLVILGYMALLVVWGLRPFVPSFDAVSISRQFNREQLMPLASLAVRADVFSAVHVAQQFLLYVPLGALLAVWPLRTRGLLAHLAPAILLAWGIEAGHLVIVDRFLDVTNALIACAGLAVGWIVVRRSGFTPYGESMPRRR
ncbi:MAG TPA: VanZ family protein [Gemmatimonadaceae bacterium]|nr:VanZ family protein [Gemmatimonadaceae bacterium]